MYIKITTELLQWIPFFCWVPTCLDSLSVGVLLEYKMSLCSLSFVLNDVWCNPPVGWPDFYPGYIPFQSQGLYLHFIFSNEYWSGISDSCLLFPCSLTAESLGSRIWEVIHSRTQQFARETNIFWDCGVKTPPWILHQVPEAGGLSLPGASLSIGENRSPATTWSFVCFICSDFNRSK